ncbi:hypothetical protein MUP01_04080 [Candidatus Bathyarchaeota archaeon]|nr:hypothetical protein [Candidatus Bathyarchaeota archaeon]
MTEVQVCPNSSVVSGLTELRKCGGWGFCGRSGYAGDYKKCPTFKELETKK